MPLKLITPESSPLRQGLVMFFIVWVVLLLVGLVMVGAGVILLEVPLSMMWWPVIITAPVSFYIACKATRVDLQARRERAIQAERITGQHPVLGPYYSFPYYRTWRALSVATSLGEVSFRGSGLAPSDAQVAQCLQIIERLPHLVSEAVPRLLPPPEPYVGAETCEFTPTSVDLSGNGDFELCLRAPLISDQIREFPSATFSAEGLLRSAEWNP